MTETLSGSEAVTGPMASQGKAMAGGASAVPGIGGPMAQGGTQAADAFMQFG